MEVRRGVRKSMGRADDQEQLDVHRMRSLTAQAGVIEWTNVCGF